jgi:hypothetical protein
MSRRQKILVGLAVMAASLVPAATASAGLLSNHNETLLLD